MKVLVVVDPQVDFAHPEGSLYVNKASEAFGNINKLLESDLFDFKVVTADWHPKNHVSFGETHGAKLFSTRETDQRGKTIKQVMWPNHCVVGSSGANFHPRINTNLAHSVFRKGTCPDRECYSVFEYVQQKGKDIERFTPFYSMVEALIPYVIVVCGFAGDYCVKSTALSSRDLAGKVVFVSDACASVTPEKNEALYLELREKNISVMTTEESLLMLDGKF